MEEPGRPLVTTRVVLDGGGRLDRVMIAQEDPLGRGRVWPQQLDLLLADADAAVRVPVRLAGSTAVVDSLSGRPGPGFVLPNAAGVEYGRFRLDARSVDRLMATLPEVNDPLVRGIAWVTLWDGVLEGEVAPAAWFELLLRGLAAERVEQNAQRILGYLGTTFWALLDDDQRLDAAPRVEAALWAALAAGGTPTLKAAYFRAWRDVVLSPAGVGRMRRIWAGDEEVTGVSLAEPDFTALAEELAVRGVDGSEAILDEQAERIENPDRLARFTFVRPALSADRAVREAFFLGLADPARREREPWALAAVGYLHHPLRAAHARRFIQPGLEMLEEIQRTGDIFFPAGWLDATLRGHRSAAAAEIVQAFLDGTGPDYPPHLRAKILQSADLLFRSVRLGGR